MGDFRRNLCWDLSTFENFMEEGAFAKWNKSPSSILFSNSWSVSDIMEYGVKFIKGQS